MKRNPLLRSTLTVFVCLLVAGFIFNDRSVMAQGSATEGSLLALNEQGQPAGPCPLKHTEVKTEVSGFLARVTVTQHFENPFSDKIEAVYVFPLPPSAAVDDMTMVVGSRTVKGKIMRREDAQATYDSARARGQVAGLLHQQRPNIFTQSVANILPGQQIEVIISYVETLKYDEGAYEWSFPMVVGPRYIPGPEKTAPESGPAPESSAETLPDQSPSEQNPKVPDADRITPPVMPKGMRPGHDISIEVVLDSGVPLVSLTSETHQIEALQPGAGRAVVRLKDQATIPNQDFILKYDVAGSRIEDALLAHRDSNGGFFTFILQPPQRVTAADTMPKELVFVLDTSGSMEGFPLDKAKETMRLALDGLYPQDTFNIITFAGDTRILFQKPVQATPENLNKAKKLLAHTKSEGGTEMMKAIRAALAPSDAQDHVRITCFLTDGQVGNDMEIIAEVQKHPRARIFALGFGSAPNRFLLDKITEYGRGEVEYVTEEGNTSKVAKRFHERVRNPLLTDVSIDWGGLPVTDVYPKTIPDLFSAKPVIVSGRYAGAGKGTIRLRGMMSGHESVREIAVELPEQEAHHDVLAKLWARRKVDDLMGQDMSGAQAGKMRDGLQTEITALGLTYRMLTQFTSFVAVENTTVTDGVEPRRVDVPVAAPAASGCALGGVCATVTVSAAAANTSSDYASISTSITVHSIQDLPLNGRSVQGLFLMAPGTVAVNGSNTSGLANISVNGQTSSSNNFILDGVSGNFGVSPGGQSPGASAAGSTPALTAAGATNPTASLSATQEVAIRTYSSTAEFGRNSGGHISLVTKSGTNTFHGSGLYLFSHQGLNANDWFANSRGLAKPGHGSNEFGGTLGGPIKRDRFFFFASYEGLRLRQPVVSLSDVPALTARSTAAPGIQSLLNAYPLPNGPERSDGFAEFASSFTNSARHDAGSLRLDRFIGNRLTLSGYYNFTDSRAEERGGGGFSPNTLNRLFNRAQSFTGTANYTISPRMIAEIKTNYSHFTSRGLYRVDTFGGAQLPVASLFLQPPQSGSFSADLNGRNTVLMSAGEETSTQRQFNVLGAITMTSGNHAIKFGADYRRMFPIIGLRRYEQSALFDGVSQVLTATAARVNVFNRSQPTRPVFNELSVYGQDDWRLTPKLTLSYGLRWEVSPAPSAADGKDALAVTQVDDPSKLNLAGPASRLWTTTYGNFGPRLGVAYQPFKDDEFVIRGGFGLRYDVANGAVGDAFADSYPFLNGQSQFNAPLSFASSPGPSNSNTVTVPFSAFDPHLRMPYSWEWNISIERALGSNQSISAAYVGTAGRSLLRTDTLLNQNPQFAFIRLTNNGASSAYHSLQISFHRRFSRRVGANASYTLGRSQDNVSPDSAARVLFRSNDWRREHGPSDFDVRHTLTGFFTYQLPAPFAKGFGNTLSRNWSLDSIFNIRSAAPVNVLYAVPTSFGFLYLRPDAIGGASPYLNDAAVAGGRRINPDAFVVPLDLRQGTLGRNALRGFPLTQVNFGFRRQFNFSENVKLSVGAEAANVFNHPNFGAPAGNDLSLGTRFGPSALLHTNPTFGQSHTNAARNAWGIAGSTFGSSYNPGGARLLKLTAKLVF